MSRVFARPKYFDTPLYYKGGTPYIPPPPDRSVELETLRQDRQDARDREDRMRREEELASSKTASAGRVGSAYNAARDYGSNAYRAKGLDPGNDPYGVMAAYNSALDRARAGAPDVVEDAGALFSPSLYTDAYSAGRSGQQGKYRKEFQNFAGEGFERSMMPDTMDDAILDALINEQGGEAQSAINNAYARGQLNDPGRAKANSVFEQQRRAGRARAEDLGLGVIGGYRKQLADEAKRFSGRIDNWDLGDQLNIGAEQENLTGMKTGFSNRLEGDILNAIGGTNFFDTATLLGKGGNASGITNNLTGAGLTGQTNELTKALVDEEKKPTTTSPIGSVGAF